MRAGECWHHMVGAHVVVVDVKEQAFRGCIGRTGRIKHDPDFGHYYLSFDDGGSASEQEVVVEQR